MDERIGKHYRKRGGVRQGEVIRITSSSSTGHVEGVVVKDGHELARALRAGWGGRGATSAIGQTRNIAESTLRRNWEPALKPRESE